MKLFYGIIPLLIILLFKFVLPEFTYRKSSHPVQGTRNTIHVSKNLHKAEKKQFIIPPRPPLRRPVLVPLPRPPPRLLIDELSPFLVPAIPSVVGLGAALLFWLSTRFSASASDIGSSELDLPISITNNNRPDISQSLSASNVATNVNSDNDQITQVNTVTVTNTNNSGRKRRKKRRVIIDEPQ